MIISSPTQLTPGWQRQRGVALAIALVFLLLLTLIGVTAMQTSTLQERMAGNVRDRNVAFQLAEEALRDAERRLQSGAIDGATSFSEVHLHGDAPAWEDVLNCSGSDVRVVEVEGAARSPCYFIEELQVDVDGFFQEDLEFGEYRPPMTFTLYQITGIGTGRTSDARVVLRATTFGATDADPNSGNGGGGDDNGGAPGGRP